MAGLNVPGVPQKQREDIVRLEKLDAEHVHRAFAAQPRLPAWSSIHAPRLHHQLQPDLAWRRDCAALRTRTPMLQTLMPRCYKPSANHLKLHASENGLTFHEGPARVQSLNSCHDPYM
jgi:hypothetical protein